MYILFDNFDDTDLNADVYYICNFNIFIKFLLKIANCESLDEIITDPHVPYKTIKYREITLTINNDVISQTVRELLPEIRYSLNYTMNSNFECIFTSNYNIFDEIDDYVYFHNEVKDLEINVSGLQSCQFQKFEDISESNVFGLLHLGRWVLIHAVYKTLLKTLKCTYPHRVQNEIFFYGGGPLGWACAGWASAYLSVNSEINIFSGTSMGALVATFCALNPRSYLLDIWLESYHKLEMIDFSYESLEHFATLFLPNSHQTFAECKKSNKNYENTDLRIIVTDFKTMEPVVFSYETTPDVRIIDALKASCSIPFVLGIYTIDNCQYVDGGMSQRKYLDKYNLTTVSITPQWYTKMLQESKHITPPFIQRLIPSFEIMEEYINPYGDFISLEIEVPFNLSDDISTKRSCMMRNFMHSYFSYFE